MNEDEIWYCSPDDIIGIAILCEYFNISPKDLDFLKNAVFVSNERKMELENER